MEKSINQFMVQSKPYIKYLEREGIKLQLGLAETLQILIGKDHTTPEGMEVAKQIEQLFKTRCAEFKERYKLNFGVYYTPKLFGLGVAQVIA